jgi:hypothetical protein
MAKIHSASQLDSQARTTLARREAQAKLAGEAAVGTLEADLQLVIASDPRQWQASSQCEDPDGSRTGAFCIRVAAAKAKIAAAKERDKLDVELSKLRAEAKAAGPVPTTADAYSENVAALLGMILGRKLSADEKRVIRAHYDVVRAIGLELVAAVGPAFHLLLVDGTQIGSGVVAAMVKRMRMRRRKAPKAFDGEPSATSAPSDPADDLDRCISDRFEADPAGAMLARDIRPIVRAWFEKQNLGKVNEKALWSRMRERFKHDGNSGRPRYLGLKPRVKGPTRLAVVGGHAVLADC